jgi:hypothetical protein
VSSVYQADSTGASRLAIVSRVVLNVLLAYAIAAVVTFALILLSELVSPSEFNPYLGQAVGGTVWTMVWLSFGSPAVLVVLACLDWGVRRTRRPRLLALVVSVLPAGLWVAAVALSGADLQGMTLAVWLLIVGLAFGRVILLPTNRLPASGRRGVA